MDTPPATAKGFGGRDVEIIPAERLPPSKRRSTKKQQTYKDYAVVLRRIWTRHKQGPILDRIELEIQAEALCQAFRKVAIDSYEYTDLEAFPIKLRSPFSELFFVRNEIEYLMNDGSNSEDIRRGASILHGFIHKNSLMISIIADHDKYSKEDQVVGDMLWTIYPPNSLVVLNVEKLRECWICRNVSIKQGDKGDFWEVTGLRIGYDGTSPGLTRQICRVHVTGSQVCKISDLPLVPIKNYQDWPSLKKTLLARAATLQMTLGKDLSLFATQEYANLGWQTEFRDYDASPNPMLLANQLTERVVVDYKAFLIEGQGDPAELIDFRDKLKQAKSKANARGVPDLGHGHSDSDSIELDSEGNRDIMVLKTAMKAQKYGVSPKSDLSTLDGLSEAVEESFNISKDDFNLLFPALVPAFGLKKKKWFWVLSEQLRDVAWNLEAFNSLQLEKATKHLIQALVRGHKESTSFDDVVSGKGQGLVFLLHGKPGLGKTLTAESVAEYLKRPLYSITGGELSTEIAHLETKLDEIFRLTKRWQAVSLLDEADVFLGNPTPAETDRSATIAVFLRMIEYFQGVLFLTTNRKQDFGQAFKSRIHVTISYGDLSEEAQAMIWEQLIEANKDVQLDKSWTPAAFSALGKLQFNGRTIKNILRTAVAYASANGEALGLRHVLVITQTELKDVDEVPSVNTDSLEYVKKAQVKAALDDLQRLST